MKQMKASDFITGYPRGTTKAEVARILRSAPGNVKVHVEGICEKPGTENRTAATMRVLGIEFQLIPG